MSVVPVQATDTVSAGTTSPVAKAYGSNVTAGNLLWAWIRVGGIGDLGTVTDSKNGAWTVLGPFANGTDDDLYFTYFPNAAAGATTLTVTSTGGATIRVTFGEDSGAATTSPIRTSTSAQGANAGSGTGINSGSVTASVGDLARGAASNTGSGPTWTAGGTTAAGTWAVDVGSNVALVSQFVEVATAGSYASDPTMSASDSIVSAIVLIKPPGGAADDAITPGTINATSAMSVTAPTLWATSFVNAGVTKQGSHSLVVGTINATSAVTAAIQKAGHQLIAAGTIHATSSIGLLSPIVRLLSPSIHVLRRRRRP